MTSRSDMAAQRQPLADDFDPYLQRDDDANGTEDWTERRRFTPSPVSGGHIPISPVSPGASRATSTAQGDQTPTPQALKPEPLSTSTPCSDADLKEPDGAAQAPRGWWLEMLGAVCSIACVIALVIVLIKFDGKLLSSWVWVASPNAVVSILSTASKAMMILTVAECISQLKWVYLGRHGPKSRLDHLQFYDNASRGPLGSLNFFWQARRVPWGLSILSYIGCLITIAALALDPFTQQVLAYTNDIRIVQGARSSVPRSQSYDYQGLGATGATNYINSARDADFVAGGVSALYGYEPEPPFDCPGSNCTFPAFQTLGLHPSVCLDVTADTIKTCDNDCANRTSSNALTNCTYTTPGGLELHARSYFGAHTGFGYTSINTTVTSAGSSTSPTLFRLGIITFDDTDALSGGTGACDISWQDTLKAYDCSFDLCAMSYENYSYVDGKLQAGQRRISTLNRTDMVGELLKYETIDGDFPGNQTYYFNVLDQSAIQTSFMQFFQVTYATATQTAVFTSALYNSDNITGTMSSMAEAMTYRVMQGPNSTVLYGNVTESKTFIHVQWPWLSLTFVLVVFSTGFLLVTVLVTSATQQLAWKSSLSPLLYADGGLGAASAGLPGRSWTREQKEARVNTIRSGLSRNRL